VGGLCGVALSGGRHVVSDADVRAMLGALTLTGDEDGRVHAGGAFALGVLGDGRRRAVLAARRIGDRPVCAALFGNRYDGAAPADVLDRYLAHGIGAVADVSGDFALAVWDGRDESLYLATDRFRVHPIFYYDRGGHFVFASRLRAVLESRFTTEQALDPTAIVDIVAGSVVPTPRTVFEHIRKLPPGHVLRRRRDTCTLEPYWDVRLTPSASFDPRRAATELRAHFSDAVSRRLAQEAPGDRVGTFLSGGVDSSTVTGVVTGLRGAPVKAFSIGFSEEQFDELRYARIAARRFDAEHVTYRVNPHEAMEALPALLDRCDEPFGNASLIPTYFCARVAREHGVDVMYAGDGGDEIFAGNERYAQWRLFDYYAAIPAPVRRWLVEPAAEALAKAGPRHALAQLPRNYIRRARIPYPARLSSYGFFYGRPLASFFEPGVVAAVGTAYNPYGATDGHYLKAGAGDHLARQLYLDLKLAIADNDLFKVNMACDVAGMAVRYPFLDDRLVDFAFTIPSAVKMRARKLRAFFKETYAGLLPEEIVKKKKHGFGLPIPLWLRTDRRFGEMTGDLLGGDGYWRQYVRRDAMDALLRQSATEPGSITSTIVWNLLMLELWQRRQHERAPGALVVSGQV
jgi:asparagine synthase (glutamine-hydrolysing)